MTDVLANFLRCPADFVKLASPEGRNSRPGYFSFGPGATGYGQSVFDLPATINGNALPDLARYVIFDGSILRLPFNVSDIIDNLRLERYRRQMCGPSAVLSSETARRLYYYVRPMLGDSSRRGLQRLFFRDRNELPFPKWPVDTSVERIFDSLLFLTMKLRNVHRIPFIWFWPDGALSSVIVTHDVETGAGLDFVPRLMDIDDEFGIPASFQVVPERRYAIGNSVLESIRARGYEINLHGLNHDGNLFRNRSTFLEQATVINKYVRSFGTEGFRSACMYRNVDWYEDLDISYDMSVPNVAHLEPQRGGCCTVFPYFIGRIVELPLTTVQDYSLFHILGDYSIDLWKKQIDLIRKHYGLISFIAHPDYLLSPKARFAYEALLAHLCELRQEGKAWIAVAGDVNRWWRERSEMQLTLESGRWRIVGRGCDRARIGFVNIEEDHIVYTVGKECAASAEEDRYLIEQLGGKRTNLEYNTASRHAILE